MKDLAWYMRELRARKHPYRPIGEYSVNYKPVLHECRKCGYQVSTAPRDVLRNAGCARCNGTNYKKTHEDYVATVAAKAPRIEVVGQYKTMATPIEHRCKDCGHSWQALPINVVKPILTGCPECAKASRVHAGILGRSNKRRYRIRGRAFWLQGYEAMAIRWLISEMDVDVKTVRTKDLPRFRYKFAGKEHWYYPDFMVKHRIVEVKSTYTAGLNKGKVYYAEHTEMWERLKAKARSVERSGAEFRLIVMDKIGRRIQLPAGWKSMSADQVISAIGPLRSE